ncbi:hypothetical protein IMCC1989_1233 [gamma proteobacterium IMCC1989]|jgi:hypothetical protein|nr:hypothetical protein IMCC1989_1233 [gamma proteobacterium IMCC1989]
MYIDSVIAMSLAVIVLMIVMMVYLYRYANRHIDMDERKAKKRSDVDHAPLANNS